MLSRANALGAVTALGLLGPLGIRVAAAAEHPDAGDMKLLDGAISLERAAIKAYADASAANLLSAPVAAVLTQFSNDHTAQRDALVLIMQESGATPGTDTTVLTLTPPQNEADVLNNALTYERQIASYYLAAIPEFKNRDFAKTAGSIMGVDATHVALLSEALRRNPAYPGGFLA
jgi:rubrerythrin